MKVVKAENAAYEAAKKKPLTSFEKLMNDYQTLFGKDASMESNLKGRPTFLINDYAGTSYLMR